MTTPPTPKRIAANAQWVFVGLHTKLVWTGKSGGISVSEPKVDSSYVGSGVPSPALCADPQAWREWLRCLPANTRPVVEYIRRIAPGALYGVATELLAMQYDLPAARSLTAQLGVDDPEAAMRQALDLLNLDWLAAPSEAMSLMARMPSMASSLQRNLDARRSNVAYRTAELLSGAWRAYRQLDVLRAPGLAAAGEIGELHGAVALGPLTARARLDGAPPKVRAGRVVLFRLAGDTAPSCKAEIERYVMDDQGYAVKLRFSAQAACREVGGGGRWFFVNEPFLFTARKGRGAGSGVSQRPVREVPTHIALAANL